MSPDLEALARELDELGKTPARREPDVPPDFGGTDWRLVRSIGKGAMGTVYEAEQISLARKVAIKVLPVAVSSSPSRRARFLREAQTLAMLHHPNIVKVYAAGTAGERLFYAMDMVQGTDLRSVKPAGADDVAILGLTAAQALAYAHRCGVIHQDVKPANLLVDGEGNLHLADFGIAALLQGADYVASSGGTHRYMAPEMQNGRGIASPASDQYALGVTLTELAQGAKDHHIPSDLTAIFNKMTAPEPDARYPDMEAVADDLQRFLRHEPVLAQPPSLVRRFSLWTRRNPAAAIGAVVRPPSSEDSPSGRGATRRRRSVRQSRPCALSDSSWRWHSASSSHGARSHRHKPRAQKPKPRSCKPKPRAQKPKPRSHRPKPRSRKLKQRQHMRRRHWQRRSRSPTSTNPTSATANCNERSRPPKN